MKSIIEQYGGAVVAVICLLFLWRILFLGESSVIVQLSEGGFLRDWQMVSEERGVAFDIYKSAVHPEITVKDKYALEEGQFIFPRDMFRAISHKQEEIDVEIEGVWNLSGEEVDPLWRDDGKFAFREKGIYWIYLKAKDKDGYEEGIFMKVFVNER